MDQGMEKYYGKTRGEGVDAARHILGEGYIDELHRSWEPFKPPPISLGIPQPSW
jgi:hypothetical protein